MMYVVKKWVLKYKKTLASMIALFGGIALIIKFPIGFLFLIFAGIICGVLFLAFDAFAGKWGEG